MRKMSVLLAATFAVAVLAAGTSMAAAEPQKNQVSLEASCDNGQDYTLVLNGEGIVGHVLGSTDNIIPVKYTVTYLDAETKEQVASYTYDTGQNEGLERNLVSCSGVTRLEDWKMGDVISIFNFQALLTPRNH